MCRWACAAGHGVADGGRRGGSGTQRRGGYSSDDVTKVGVVGGAVEPGMTE